MMKPLGGHIILTFILVCKIKDVISDRMDYWSDNFDENRNCENEGRRHIHLISH